MTDFYTRKDYLNDSSDQTAAHRKYYGQFVTDGLSNVVARQIGRDRIAKSTDPHLNDIPLVMWDRLEPIIRDMCLSRMGDINGAVSVNENGSRRINWSLSDAVCIAKEAARQIKESTKAEAV